MGEKTGIDANWRVEARDGDKKQARRRVNYLVEQGRIPHPNSLPCIDCGHCHSPVAGRHEYDHHLGYGTSHQTDVEVVCSMCHHRRELERGVGGKGGCPANIIYLIPRPAERNPAAKLSWDIVHAIRNRSAAGESNRSIARHYSISSSQVGNIVRGLCWREQNG